MNSRRYWKNRLPFLLTNLVCMAALTVFLLVCGNSVSAVVLILIVPSKGYQSSQLFYGRLSEMRLWTRPLSAREIKANVCGVDPSTNGLVSYWRMNEGEGTTFYDLSPSKRDISYKNGITIDWTYDDTNKCLE